MGPCGGPPKTIRQRYIILNYSVRGVGGIKPVNLAKNGDENWYMVNLTWFYFAFSKNYSPIGFEWILLQSIPSSPQRRVSGTPTEPPQRTFNLTRYE